ncbi:MAG: hypothetical protein ACXVFN_12590 [Solirubrobacteraceae bacterium]
MRRLSAYAWTLIAVFVATVALNAVAPKVGIFAAVVLALLLMAAAAEGMSDNAGFFDIGAVSERRREALARRYRRGRPGWARRAPDHADEPPDLIWARERRRRGLG